MKNTELEALRRYSQTNREIVCREYENLKTLPGAVEIKLVIAPVPFDGGYTSARSLVFAEYADVLFAGGRGYALHSIESIEQYSEAVRAEIVRSIERTLADMEHVRKLKEIASTAQTG